MYLKATQALSVLESTNQLFVELFTHGTLSVEVYKPIKTDKQTPHDRDEIYMIIDGTGDFFNGTTTSSFQRGDLLFVPAGIDHRFINFSDDFSTWVIFYGPKRGERNSNDKQVI